MSLSIRPASGTITWAVGGMDRAAPSDTIVATSGYAWLVTVVATSACDTGASTCSPAPTTEGATSAGGSSVRSDVGGGVTSAVVCSVTPEGALSASVSA